MNKKIVLSALVSSVLLLASCGTKPLWTFEEEIKAEQLSYSKNVEKFFENIDWFYEWKFVSKGELKIDLDSPTYWKANILLPFSSKSISEKEKVALDLGLDASLKIKTLDESKIAESLKNEANLDAKYDFKAKIWFVDGILYSNLKNLSLEAKYKDEAKNKEFEEWKKLIQENIKNYIWKFYSFDFTKLEWIDSLIDEFKKSYALQWKTIEMYKEWAKLYLAWDIFSKAEKTTYEWKEAYKFSIDQQKLEKHNSVVLKTLFEKYPDVMVSIGMTKEAVDSIIKNYEEKAKDPKNFEEANKDAPEMYLTRAKDGWANIFIKKVTKFENSIDKKVSVDEGLIEILESEIKLTTKPSEWDNLFLSLKANSSGKISYEVNFEDKDKKSKSKLNWEFGLVKKWESLEQLFTLKIDFPKNSDLYKYNFMFKDWWKVDISLNTTTTKDDSIKITKESITENSKEIISLNDMFGEQIDMFLWIYGNLLKRGLNMDSIDDNFGYEEDDFDYGS